MNKRLHPPLNTPRIMAGIIAAVVGIIIAVAGIIIAAAAGIMVKYTIPLPAVMAVAAVLTPITLKALAVRRPSLATSTWSNYDLLAA